MNVILHKIDGGWKADQKDAFSRKAFPEIITNENDLDTARAALEMSDCKLYVVEGQSIFQLKGSKRIKIR